MNILKLQKYFYYKCGKVLTKKKKYGKMLFGQERIDGKTAKPLIKSSQKNKFSYKKTATKIQTIIVTAAG